jgi:RNA polymerase sigma-70 factor (ECF subfamily)
MTAVSVLRDPAVVSDADLARQVRIASHGDSRASEAELFRRFAPRVRLYGLRHLRDEHLADDLVQQTMELVITKLRDGQVEHSDRIASFILGCARMNAHTIRRKTQREQPVGEQLETLAAQPVLPRSPLTTERLAGCLAALSERERAIVTLSFYGERTGPEVAAALGTTAGNVRVIRHRAVARLRSCMGVKESDHER